MRQFLLFLILAFGQVAQADILDGFKGCEGLDPESSAILVIGLATGDKRVSYNWTLPLVPASIMKCVTVATLLDKMDTDDRFHTRVYTTGPIKDSILEGNIVTVGSGDPSLNSRFVEDNSDICAEIANALANEGVTRIRGRIVADENLWEGPAIPPTWMSGDLPHSYGTGSHGLNFEDNASGNRSVSNPASVFDTRLRGALAKKNIILDGEDIREGERNLLPDHQSVPLDEIMRSCRMRSDNQYAQAL